jgi:phosphoglycolate phosphatase-like HAD superfamily hydrolase
VSGQGGLGWHMTPGVWFRGGPPPRPAKRGRAAQGTLGVPYRVRQAIQALTADAAECVLIGDSDSDVAAAHAAGVNAVGYANKPGKADRLRSAGADAITDSMAAIAQAASANNSLTGR